MSPAEPRAPLVVPFSGPISGDDATCAAETFSPTAAAVARLLDETDAARRAESDTAPSSGGGRAPACAPAAAATVRVDALDLAVSGVLGQGGMGIVECARQASLEREVALKRVRPDRMCPPAVEALATEARLMGRLEHPNIVPVHVLGRDERDAPVLVMKRVEGVAWRDLIVDPAHPAWAAWPGDRLDRHLGFFTQVCNAAHFAHSRGVLHRDLKPANVMIGAFGEVNVLDWGVAVALDGEGRAPSEPFAGSPAYAAPEMVGPGALTARTDVYLLGATLHEVLTGRPPHEGPTLLAVMVAAREAAPPAYGPEVPAELAAIARRALAADPAERFPSAAALRDAIGGFLEHRGSIAVAAAAGERLRELRERLAADHGQGDGAAVVGIRKLAAECRFGFQHALRTWSDNGPARDGLCETLSALLRFELGAGNLGAAEAVLTELSELSAPDPQLLAALESLRAEVRARDEARERLRALEHDLDARVGRQQRAVAWTWLGAVGIGTALAFVLGRELGWFEPSHASNLLFAGPMAVLAVATFWFGRRTLLATRYNRAVSGSLAAFCVYLFVNRGVGAWFGTPVDTVLVQDLFCLAFACVALAIGADPRFFRLAALTGLLGVLGLLLPRYALAWMVVALTVGAWEVLRGWARAAAAARGAGGAAAAPPAQAGEGAAAAPSRSVTQ